MQSVQTNTDSVEKIVRKQKQQVLLRVEVSTYETLVKKSRARIQNVQEYIYTLIEKDLAKKDITEDEQTLLKETVKLISVNLFENIKMIVEKFYYETKLTNQEMVNNFKDIKEDYKNLSEEIKNIFEALREIYELNNSD
jgi:hypothetical protein